MNHIPDIVRGREPRPFRDWVIEAKALGFEIRVHTDEREYKVWVMLKPTTRKARTAVDRELGDDCECITCETVYDKGRLELMKLGMAPSPIENEARVIAFAIDDTAAYAIVMAQGALSRA